MCSSDLVFEKDGAVIGTQLSGSQLKFELAGPVTWVTDASGRVEKWSGDRLIERTQTALRHGSVPVLAAATGHTWRQEQAWLIEQETGARVGQVLEGQTWLWSGERLGLGFYRAGGDALQPQKNGLTVAFLLRAGKSGLKQLDGITWKGRVVDAHAVFDAKHALLTVVTDDGTRERVQRWLISEDGGVVATSNDSARGHAAVLGGRVVIATDAGLVAMKGRNDA